MAKNTIPARAAARAKGERTRVRVEEFVAEFCRRHPYGPSFAEIAAGIGLEEGSVAYPVKLLIAEGRLVRDVGVARSLRPARTEA